MVKSNINDWIVCQPNGGSIVTEKGRSLSCQNIKNVATACSGVVPNKIDWFSRGPLLKASSAYYLFDGDTRQDWPPHELTGHVTKIKKTTRKGSAIQEDKSIFA